MAFDNGEQPATIIERPISEHTLEQREKAFVDYADKVKAIKADTLEARAILDQVNAEIAQRKEDLKTLYASSVDSLGQEVKDLRAEVEDKKAILRELDTQIDSLTKERDSISLDFTEREAALESDIQAFNSTIAATDDKEKKVDADRVALEVREIQFNDMSAKFEAHARESLAAVEVKLKEAKEIEARNQVDLAKLEESLAEVKAATSRLDEAKADLEKQSADLMPVILMAEQVNKDKKWVESEKAVIKNRQKQLDDDTAQIRATKIAQDGREAELRTRLKTVQDAEKSLGGTTHV